MKITLKKYPELKWAYKLLKVFSKAIIAGGVPRDLINGRDYEDVDIFIPAPTFMEQSKISMAIGYLAKELKVEPCFNDYYQMPNSIICIEIGNLDICILSQHFSDEGSLVATFDMVSSQAWLEPVKGGFDVKASDLFHELNDKKVLGFYTRAPDDGSHVERIKKKYPDYLPLSLTQPQSARDNGFDDCPF